MTSIPACSNVRLRRILALDAGALLLACTVVLAPGGTPALTSPRTTPATAR